VDVEPAEAHVHPARVQCRHRAELLGRLQRRRDRELHRAGADPDPGGGRGDQRHQHRRGRRRHPGREVVLGHPEPPVARPLRHPGEVDGVAQRVGRGATGRDRGEVGQVGVPRRRRGERAGGRLRLRAVDRADDLGAVDRERHGLPHRGIAADGGRLVERDPERDARVGPALQLCPSRGEHGLVLLRDVADGVHLTGLQAAQPHSGLRTPDSGTIRNSTRSSCASPGDCHNDEPQAYPARLASTIDSSRV
jgi:hypothetical protein